MNTRTQPIAGFYDAVIVGARVAGASTAMLLARKGLRVLVVDRGREGTDTLSTHALMRGGVMQLFRWGLLDRIQAAGTPAVRTTTFHYGDESVEVAIKPRDGIDALYAPRRILLDAVLVDAAREAGADVRHGVQALDLTRDSSGRVNGIVVKEGDGEPRAVRAGIVIGADGLHSRVARLVGAPVEQTGFHASATIYGYWPLDERGGYHWYYRPGVSVGTIPTNDGRMCVFASMSSDRFRDELRGGVEAVARQAFAETVPELAETLSGPPQGGVLYPFAGQRGFLKRSWGPGWALVGDAGYFKDPITAHGITDALLDAELLARTVAQGDDAALERYGAVRNERAGTFLRLTDGIASFRWNLDELKETHLRLSRLMAEDVACLEGMELSGEAARGWSPPDLLESPVP
jgi:2-polyprenyl-6-methoxyphenol hydroxylase-like FAD-dependent oxidoreductase